ncbi:hypothetical protein ACIDE9_08620 [Methylophilus sp. 'Pure River']
MEKWQEWSLYVCFIECFIEGGIAKEGCFCDVAFRPFGELLFFACTKNK